MRESSRWRFYITAVNFGIVCILAELYDSPVSETQVILLAGL